MADEMDEPRGAGEEKANPNEMKAEGINASAASETESAAPVVEAVAGAAESSVEDAGVATQTAATKSEASTVESEGHSRGAEASGANQRESHGTQSAPAGTPPGGNGPSHVGDGELDRPGLDLLYDVELDATLQFGSKEMLLRDVLELGPGDVVELDRHIAQPVDLVVGDRIVARGEVVVASGNFALRVTEVATPQMRLESIRCLF